MALYNSQESHPRRLSKFSSPTRPGIASNILKLARRYGLLTLFICFCIYKLDALNDFSKDNKVIDNVLHPRKALQFVDDDDGEQIPFKQPTTATVTVTNHVTVKATVTTTVKSTATVIAPAPQIERPATSKDSDNWSCEDCPYGDPICEEYGMASILRSRQFMGSGYRIRKLLQKALLGQPIQIGIMGGSATAGQGLEPVWDGRFTESRQRNTWAQQVLTWFKTEFPKGNFTLIDGSQPATGLEYFGVCYLERLPEDVDFILIDAAINDIRWNHDDNLVQTERMLRGLLSLPNEPAVIFTEICALVFEELANAGHQHANAARHYDVGTISLKNVVIPQVLLHPKLHEDYFARWKHDGIDEPDLRHLGELTHKALADFINSYLNVELCRVKRELAGHGKIIQAKDEHWPSDEESSLIPRLGLLDRWNTNMKVPSAITHCYRVKSPKPEYSLQMLATRPGPAEGAQGWYEWSSSPEKHYFIAKDVGARVSFALPNLVLGYVEVQHLKSKTFGLGDAWCWITPEGLEEDSKKWTVYRRNGVRLEGWWQAEGVNIPEAAVIQETGPRGNYTLYCEILGDTKVKLSGPKRTEFRIITLIYA